MSQWIASHWAMIVSVATGIAFVWSAGKFFAKIVTTVTAFFSNLTIGLEMIKQANSTTTLLANNHLPHLQAEMEKANLILPTIHLEMVRAADQVEGVRDDFRTLTAALLARRD